MMGIEHVMRLNTEFVTKAWCGRRLRVGIFFFFFPVLVTTQKRYREKAVSGFSHGAQVILVFFLFLSCVCTMSNFNSCYYNSLAMCTPPLY